MHGAKTLSMQCMQTQVSDLGSHTFQNLMRLRLCQKNCPTSCTAKFAAHFLSCCSCNKPPQMQEEEDPQPSPDSRSTHSLQRDSSNNALSTSEHATVGRPPVDTKANASTLSPGKKVVCWLKSAVAGKAKEPTRTADLSTMVSADDCSLIPAATSPSVNAQPLPNQLQASEQQLSQQTLTEPTMNQHPVKGKLAYGYNVHSDAAVANVTAAAAAAASVQPQPLPSGQMLSRSVSVLQHIAEPSSPPGVLDQSPA